MVSLYFSVKSTYDYQDLNFSFKFSLSILHFSFEQSSSTLWMFFKRDCMKMCTITPKLKPHHQQLAFHSTFQCGLWSYHKHGRVRQNLIWAIYFLISFVYFWCFLSWIQCKSFSVSGERLYICQQLPLYIAELSKSHLLAQYITYNIDMSQQFTSQFLLGNKWLINSDNKDSSTCFEGKTAHKFDKYLKLTSTWYNVTITEGL